MRKQTGQLGSGAASAPASGSLVTLIPARNAAGSSHSSQHAGIFSMGPFSAPPSDGQLPVTSPAEALPKQRAQKLTFLNAAHLPHRPARAGGVEMTPLPPSLHLSPQVRLRCSFAEVVQRVTDRTPARQTEEATRMSLHERLLVK